MAAAHGSVMGALSAVERADVAADLDRCIEARNLAIGAFQRAGGRHRNRPYARKLSWQAAALHKYVRSYRRQLRDAS